VQPMQSDDLQDQETCCSECLLAVLAAVVAIGATLARMTSSRRSHLSLDGGGRPGAYIGEVTTSCISAIRPIVASYI
jgi:hypothetical protein